MKNNTRPLKIIFGSIPEMTSFLYEFVAAKLKNGDSKFSNVSVSQDRTIRERQYLNSLKV